MMNLLLLIALLVTPTLSHAQTEDGIEQSFEAFIESKQVTTCDDGTNDCAQWQLTGTSGEFDGESFTITTTPLDTLGGRSPLYEAGDTVIVQTQMSNGVRTYFMSDMVRRTPLVWLAALFLGITILFGGIRALRSFAGMIVSLAVLLLFIVPRILAGNSPLLITLIGSMVIMIVTFVLTHGWNKKTAAAFAGTCGSLLLTALLAWFWSGYAHLTGTADEEMFFLLADYPDLNTTGILLSAIIIGTLGVLDDVTISQSSAVFELRGANPRWNARELYASALRIGSDHIAAAINTLILAYAGASLSLLLLLVGIPSGEPWWIFLSREPIATEIVRTIVGSIGLLAAVPLTTWIASKMAMNTPAESLDHVLQAHKH